jgi:hypothetical protein
MFDFDPLRYQELVASGPQITPMMDGSLHVLSLRTYDHITANVFEAHVAFLVDYALKLSEAYQPTFVRRRL